MKTNRDIACGLTRQNRYKVAAFWKEVTEVLNAAGPPIKNSFEWKKVWTHQKRYVRNKAVENLKYSKGTGWGPNKHKPLTPSEEEIYTLIGTQEALEGVENAQVFGMASKNPNPANIELENSLKEVLTPIESPKSFLSDEHTDAEIFYIPQLKKRKNISTNEAVETELENQKKLCEIIADIGMQIETWNETNNSNAKRAYKALEKANYLKEKELKLREKHYNKMEELKRYKIDSKLDISRKLLEIEELKMKTK